MTDSRRRAVFVGTLLLAAIARVVVPAAIPSSARNFVYDDALYARTADSLLRGEWLGPYDRATLSKAPGYAFLLAAGRFCGLSRRATDDVFFAAAVLVAAYGLRRLKVGRVGVGAASVAALFHPALYGAASAWTVRESCVAGQYFLLLGLSCATLAEGRFFARATAAVLHGVALGWFWFTREESAWILAPLLVAGVALVLVERRRRETTKAALLAALLLAAPSIVAPPLFGAGLRAANEARYGAPVSIEEADPDYRAAMAAVLRVADASADYSPVRAASREVLYAASPSFARLKPTLESSAFRFPGASDASGDVYFAYWPFLLRDAAANAGLYRDLSATKAFYAALASEIHAAADRGLAPHAGPRDTGRLPSFRAESIGPWCRAFARRALSVSKPEFAAAAIGTPPPPLADAEAAGLFARTLGGFSAPPLDATVAARYALLATAHETWGRVAELVFVAALAAAALRLLLLRFVGGPVGATFVALHVLAALAGLAAVIAYVEIHLWSIAPDYLLRLHPPALFAAALALSDCGAAVSALVFRGGAEKFRGYAALLVLIGAAAALGAVAQRAAADLEAAKRIGIPIAAFRPIDDPARPADPLLRLEGGALFDSDDGRSFGAVLSDPDAAIVWIPRALPDGATSATVEATCLPPASSVVATFRAVPIGADLSEGEEEAVARVSVPGPGPFRAALDTALRPGMEYRLSAAAPDGAPVRLRVSSIRFAR